MDKRFIFKAKEKTFFVRTVHKLEAFLGVRVLTHCVMSNHFHILLEVPDPEEIPPLTKEKLIELLPLLYDRSKVLAYTAELAATNGNAASKQKILDRFQDRMGRLDVFMKELKQRFSIWYNRNNNRKGTLWEERFKSVLVEGKENALITMAAYIDLNPVRGGLVKDPKDYKWSGYGEAVAGRFAARQGLGKLMSEVLHGELPASEINWRTTSNRYRLILYFQGEKRSGDAPTGKRPKAGFSRAEIEAVVAQKGRLTLQQALQCRVRYFVMAQSLVRPASLMRYSKPIGIGMARKEHLVREK